MEREVKVKVSREVMKSAAVHVGCDVELSFVTLSNCYGVHLNDSVLKDYKHQWVFSTREFHIFLMKTHLGMIVNRSVGMLWPE